MHRYHKSCSQADLTVLRVITIVRTKTSNKSYISEFSVEVTQIVFSSFDRFTAYYNIMSKNFKNLIST